MKIFLVYILLFISPVSFAKLIIVSDTGGHSAISYYQGIGIIEKSTPSKTPDLTTKTDAAMLPVVSKQLSVGKVQPHLVNIPGMSPIFLIGDDKVSIDWLKQRKHALIKLGATGLIVNIASAHRLATIRHIAPEISFFPASADDLATRLGLTHYPVLITATGIEQ